MNGSLAEILDPNLVNSWGLAIAPSGPIWISDNGTGLSTVYEDRGNCKTPGDQSGAK